VVIVSSNVGRLNNDCDFDVKRTGLPLRSSIFLPSSSIARSPVHVVEVMGDGCTILATLRT
jgi:hypothetical protein